MRAVLSIILMFQMVGAYAQLETYDITQLDSLQKVNPKPALVFIHTDWCRYCKAMQHTSFENEEVQEILNDQFYFISFNAESKEVVKLGGVSYAYKPTGSKSGIHSLAITLATVEGKLNYPTLTFLNEQKEIIYQYAGYLNAKEMLQLLRAISQAKQMQ